MPTKPLPELATPEEFDRFGVHPSRHTAGEEDIRGYIRAGSGDILTVLEPYCRLPLLEWGDNLVAHVCTIAAWYLRGNHGFDPRGDEFDALMARYKIAQTFLSEIVDKKKPPIGIVDSTDLSLDAEGNRVQSYPNRPRVKGYAKRVIYEW